MLFKQIRRNAAKNRKGNGLFFGSLVIAIVAFYTLLSLGEQDVLGLSPGSLLSMKKQWSCASIGSI